MLSRDSSQTTPTTVEPSPRRGVDADEQQSTEVSPQDPFQLPANDSQLNVEQYNWQEVEDLMAILTADSSYILGGPQAFLDMSYFADFGNTSVHEVQVEQDIGTSAHAHQAVRHMHSLVQQFSIDLSREIEVTGATANLFDTCLGCFFSHFLPTFPVVHQPTFSLKSCSPPLLLNMIALGSRFVAGEVATAMGEAMWKVALAAVSTSWQSLLDHTDPEGQSTSMQLVMTALLSQAYAVLSGNSSLRLTSQAYHGLGFYWARQCNSTPSSPTIGTPTGGWTAQTKTQRWKEWAAQESRGRVLLGHYILDGLICQSSGLLNSARHTVNNLSLPCSDAAFDAPTADEWFRVTSLEPPISGLSFRERLLEVFDFGNEPPSLLLSHMSVPVLMEALQSLVSESCEAGGPSVGLPSRHALGHALWRLYDSQIMHQYRPRADFMDLSIRWHIVSISLCVEPRSLTHQLCRRHGIVQKIYGGANAPSVTAFCLEDWKVSHLARRALLHVISILDLIQQLQIGKTKALHLPFTIYTAAMVLIAVATGSSSRVQIPSVTCWKAVCDLGEQVETQELPWSDTASTSSYVSFGAVPIVCATKARNLLVDINALLAILESATSIWGITKEMRVCLQQLTATLT
ncbi:hypothetical protein LTR17_022423 [Elasticomyces elasticus]|nr:hypothetical protein LTR17_022423 [Elasticomyces elasticus]